MQRSSLQGDGILDDTGMRSWPEELRRINIIFCLWLNYGQAAIGIQSIGSNMTWTKNSSDVLPFNG